MLPIHLALLNVIEIEFGLWGGRPGVDVAGKQRPVFPGLKKHGELLPLLGAVKSSCVHVTVT